MKAMATALLPLDDAAPVEGNAVARTFHGCARATTRAQRVGGAGGPRWETRRPDVGLLLRRPGAVRVPGSGRRDSRVWGTRLGNSALGSSGFPQRVDTEGDRFA